MKCEKADKNTDNSHASQDVENRDKNKKSQAERPDFHIPVSLFYF
jgi:hypothetical protein